MTESEKQQHEGEGDTGWGTQEKYLQHLQQKEEEEDEGWGDEGSDDQDPEQVLSMLPESGNSEEPSAPSTPPPPGPPPPTPPSVTAPSKGVKLKLKAQPDDAPPPPPSPGAPPPLPPSVMEPAKGVKLRVKTQPGDAPSPPPSPGPPPPVPPSVTDPKKIKFKAKTNSASTNENQNDIDNYNQREDSTTNHDDNSETYAANDNYNIDQTESNTEQNYEAGSPIRRSQGYDSLNGDADDQRELYVNNEHSVSPEPEGQSPSWASDENGYDFPEGFSEDQQQAMTELQQLRLDLNYAGKKSSFLRQLSLYINFLNLQLANDHFHTWMHN